MGCTTTGPAIGTTGDPMSAGPGSDAGSGSVFEPQIAQKRNRAGFSAPHVPHIDTVGDGFALAGGLSAAATGLGAAAGATAGSGSCASGISGIGGANEYDGASGRERRADSGPATDGAFNRLPQS